MVNGKKLAQLLKKSKKLVVEKRNEKEFLLTDTYIIVRLDDKEFGEFFAKYNSYKNTANIPFKFEDTICSLGKKDFNESNLEMATVINEVDGAKKKIKLTKFYKSLKDKDAQIFKAGDQLGMFDRKYEFLFDLGDDYKTKGKKGPLFILKEGIVQVVIMPIIDYEKDCLKDELTKLCGIKNKVDKVA